MKKRRRAPRKKRSAAPLRGLFGATLVVGMLYVAKPVIVPLALAVLITFILTPVVITVQRTGLGRVPAVLLVVCLALGLSGTSAWGVGGQVGSLARELPTPSREIKTMIRTLRSAGRFSRLFQMFREIGESEPAKPLSASAPEDAALERPVIVAPPSP